MTYFEPVSIDYDNNLLLVPHINGSICKFHIKEDETWDDLVKNNNSQGWPSIESYLESGLEYDYLDASNYYSIDVRNLEEDEDCVEFFMQLWFYKIEDIDGKKLLLVCPHNLKYEDWEDISLVCIPRNEFNVYKFCKEFLLTYNNRKVDNI